MRNKSIASLKFGLIAAILTIYFTSCLNSPNGVFFLHKALAKEPITCPKSDLSGVKITKVADNIYVRKGLNEIFTKSNLAAIATISFVVGKTSVAVIDTGGSYCDGARFLKALRKFTKKPISHVINTHTHPDHVFGNAAFEKEVPIFVGHHNLKRAMADRGKLYLDNLTRIMGKDQLVGTKIIPPTMLVKEKATIDLGGKKLELQAFGTAHTDHDLTVFDPEQKVIWTGDLLFSEHTPVVDGSILGWLKQLKILSKIPAKFVVPGHGGPLLKWPEALEPQKQYLEKLTADLRKIIEEGGTMREAQNKAAVSEKNKWKLFEEFNARNASTSFKELEWE
ncbi:MAG: quinoprotein relay system zinc metallohydrolase 2 [Rhizobiales bacterium]|nr:quinoprotein relay system zinc metallohydrolase 2 [Hyphomicrobiales bacterium]